MNRVPIRGYAQPPSGGCVLKLGLSRLVISGEQAAAFGRLCVETESRLNAYLFCFAAAFGRLCVET